MPRSKQSGPHRQIYATVREDLYLAAKAKSAELRIPLRELLERALLLMLESGIKDKSANTTQDASLWDDEYISMQAQQPIGSPVELTDDEAKSIAKNAFGLR